MPASKLAYRCLMTATSPNTGRNTAIVAIDKQHTALAKLLGAEIKVYQKAEAKRVAAAEKAEAKAEAARAAAAEKQRQAAAKKAITDAKLRAKLSGDQSEYLGLMKKADADKAGAKKAAAAAKKLKKKASAGGGGGGKAAAGAVFDADALGISEAEIVERRKLDFTAAIEAAQAVVQQDEVAYRGAWNTFINDPGSNNFAERDAFDKVAAAADKEAKKRKIPIGQPKLGLNPKKEQARYIQKIASEFRKVMPGVHKTMTKIAYEANGSLKTAASKANSQEGKERVMSKARTAYDNDVSRLTDMERLALIFGDFNDMQTALQKIMSAYRLIRIKNRFAKANANAKDTAAYRDCQLLLQVPGSELQIEVQLHINVIHTLKDEVATKLGLDGRTGHDRYIEFRNLKEAAVAEYGTDK